MEALLLAVWLSGTVANVVDGDTIDVCNQTLCTRIRVWGVDAPERYTPAGQAAKAWLESWLRGKQVRCEPKGMSWGRVVARCELVDDVACLTVRAGHAADWPRYSGGFYARCK